MKTNMVDDVMGFNSPKKRIRKLSPNIIRIGDTVKIVNPEIIIRVDYPMSFDDACEEVKKLYHNEILEFLNKTIHKQETVPLYKSLLTAHINENEYVKSKIYRKLVYALAYEHMHIKGFGGKERKIYSEQRQELLGITAKSYKNIYKKDRILFFTKWWI